MARKQVIGISSYPREGNPPSFSMPCGYVDAMRRAGGIPLILPPGEPEPERVLDLVDALIVSGGGDIDPIAYGGQSHSALYNMSAERDGFELGLARALLARPRTPALFICRGMQVLNTACGGSLHPHIPDLFGQRVRHRLPPREPARHPVRIEPGNRLASILGANEVEVCSWHHQAIDRLGDGLRAIAWADDGVIEAVEQTEHPWCVGVQWHPEMQLEEEPHRRLFAALVAAAETGGERENEQETG